MRCSIPISIGIFLLLVTAAVSLADQTVVIDMPPNEYETQSGPELQHETLGATRAGAQRASAASEKRKASSKQEQSIGQVGVIVSPKAAIKSQPNRKSRSLYTCPRDTYIAVVGEHQSWYGILMSDSTTGWIEKGNVNLLNYRLTGSMTKGQSSSSANRVVDTALRYLGISYKWGGYSTNGIDCSGFVKAVFASVGVGLPRTAREQALVGTSVGYNELQPGDRLYFACKGGAVDHTGIYIGNGYFIHSSVGHGGVAVDPITRSKFLNSLVVARR